MEIGRADVLERIYLEKFKRIAAPFGEFVYYERDRAARDIGLSFTRPRSDGAEVATPFIKWFQLKGISASKLPKERVTSVVDVRLSTKHLRFWYLAPEPTFLVVYVESVDSFYITNIQKYLSKTIGRGILSHLNDTMTVPVSTSSPFDETALQQMLAADDSKHWQTLFGFSAEEARNAIRDASLVRSVAQALESKETVLVRLVDWISKSRSEVHWIATNSAGRAHTIRNQWGFDRNIESMFPCFQFDPVDSSARPFGHTLWDDDTGDVIRLRSGEKVYGREWAGEYVTYEFGVRLSDFGHRVAQAAHELEKAGVLPFLGGSEFVSIAPWEHRDI